MMKIGLSFLVIFLASATSLSSHVHSLPTKDVPIIDLGYAQYQGVYDSVNNITNYLGMRYAAPPIGDLRWRAPQPPASNKSAGVQQANTQPNECPQAPSGDAPTNPLEVQNSLTRRANAPGTEPEDCLFLNVYFPGDTIPTKPLPTLVWIYVRFCWLSTPLPLSLICYLILPNEKGGGYILGGADQYLGSDLLREANNEIVAVIIQYRLGLFGFLPGSKVKANGSLNAGLLDQDFALRWVQNHISQFGGDPTKVTIWGESAGAGSVLQHVVAHGGQTSPQLFRGAMTSSTFLPSQYMYNDTIPELLYSEVVAQTNCSSAVNSLTCLRGVNETVLETINTNINQGGFFGTFVFVPVVDGTFITQRPTESLKQGKVNGKALLSITNTNEGVIFVNQTNPINNVSLIVKTAELYASLGTPLEQDEAIMAECRGRDNLVGFLSERVDSEGKTLMITSSNPARDARRRFVLLFPYYLFGPLAIFNNTQFLAAFSGAFMAFVVSQDPNDQIVPTITPYWDMYSNSSVVMVFNQTADGTSPDIHVDNADASQLERCRFWNSVGVLTGQ
ncbi:alpha/beta-hydrolase [Gymnopus androsaceus JB14]|uniref:Carboxylic ester hydrolase n=1 Tax=Gymnopus androsaceus JB14 TaxID=1447944 RepID=A0A6A4ICW6_9AGAR|nr:alpha/beta-hydrolase [Gymnopus androsaceus JB14]